MDGTIWDRWRWRGVWFEAGWQSISALEGDLQAICSAEVLEPCRLVLAEVIANAIPLHTDGHLVAWQEWLAVYPELLRERLIADSLQRWQSSYTATTRWATVRRSQPLALMQDLVGGIRAMLRILFALNQQWEPDWKWIALLSSRLSRQPDRLVERIGDVFYLPEATGRMNACTDLLLDTLELLPASEAVKMAQLVLRQRPGLHQESGH